MQLSLGPYGQTLSFHTALKSSLQSADDRLAMKKTNKSHISAVYQRISAIYIVAKLQTTSHNQNGK